MPSIIIQGCVIDFALPAGHYLVRGGVCKPGDFYLDCGALPAIVWKRYEDPGDWIEAVLDAETKRLYRQVDCYDALARPGVPPSGVPTCGPCRLWRRRRGCGGRSRPGEAYCDACLDACRAGTHRKFFRRTTG